MRGSFRSLLAFGLSLGAALGATACDSPFTGRETARFAAAPGVPTKDDVALVDGRPFSITAFMTIRSALKKPSAETAFWVGVASLALENNGRARGQELEAPSLFAIARYAIRDIELPEAETALRGYYQGGAPTADQVRRDLEKLVGQSLVQRNPQILAELELAK